MPSPTGGCCGKHVRPGVSAQERRSGSAGPRRASLAAAAPFARLQRHLQLRGRQPSRDACLVHGGRLRPGARMERPQRLQLRAGWRQER